MPIVTMIAAEMATREPISVEVSLIVAVMPMIVAIRPGRP
jgi:hypothetical protein